MYRANIRVIESRSCLGFAAEALQGGAVVRQRLGQELQCDETVQPGVLSLVHHTHAAAAERFSDAVMGDDRPDHNSSHPTGRGL